MHYRQIIPLSIFKRFQVFAVLFQANDCGGKALFWVVVWYLPPNERPSGYFCLVLMYMDICLMTVALMCLYPSFKVTHCAFVVYMYTHNQRPREIISARKTSHKHSNTDLSRLWQLSPVMRVSTSYINSTRVHSLRMLFPHNVHGFKVAHYDATREISPSPSPQPRSLPYPHPAVGIVRGKG